MGIVVSEVPAPPPPNSIQAESPLVCEEHGALRGRLRRFVRNGITSHAAYANQQLHGEMGYMRKSTTERTVRDARLRSIGGGMTEVMLEEVVKRP